MNELNNNQQHTTINYSSEQAIAFAAPLPYNADNGDSQNWKHYLKDIPSNVSGKFTVFGLLYIFIGILNIGLEIGLLVNEMFSYLIGFFNGFTLIATGILALILCRQQIYVLTSLFIVLYFQLIVVVATFIIYCFFFYVFYNNTTHCSYLTVHCSLDKFEAILIADLLHVFITFCIITINLASISHVRRAPKSTMIQNYIVYTPNRQAAPVSFQNPLTAAINAQT